MKKDFNSATRLEECNGTPRNIFFEAIAAGNIALVTDVLAKFTDAVTWRTLRDDIPCEDEYGLHVAAREGRTEIAKLLVAAGAAVDAKDSGGQTPLMYATKGGHALLVSYFLNEAKANPGHRDGADQTPLMVAVREGRMECAALLCEKGANVNASRRDGNALFDALRSARRDAQVDIIPLLLRHGIRYDARNDAGQTALEKARADNHPLADYLAARIRDHEALLKIKAQVETERQIELLHSGSEHDITLSRPLALKLKI